MVDIFGKALESQTSNESEQYVSDDNGAEGPLVVFWDGNATASVKEGDDSGWDSAGG